MKGLKRLLSFARRACDDYNMISEGDTVAVDSQLVEIE